jgi:hypothetical protein
MPTQYANSPAYSLHKQGCTAKDFCELSDLSRQYLLIIRSRAPGRNRTCAPASGGLCSIP